MNNKIGATDRFILQATPVKNLKTKKDPGVKAQNEPEIKDEVQIRGDKEKSSTGKTTFYPEITNRDAYNALERVKSQLNTCKRNVDDSDNRMYRSNNDIQDASRELNWAEFPIRRVEMDDEHKDVSHEGYTIDNYINSADRNLNSGKSEDDRAGRNMDSVQRDLTSVKSQLQSIKNSLTQPDEQETTRLVQRAIDLTGQSQNETNNTNRSIDSAGREIDQGMGQLTWADHYIWDIRSDREGKDVSSSGRQLSYMVDRTQWDIRDAEREIRNSQTGLGRTKQSIDSVIRVVTDAQKTLIKVKKK